METNRYQYRDNNSGEEYHYLSTLRPVASLGYDRIPALLLEPGSDPEDGTRRDFYTYEPLPVELMQRWDIVLVDYQLVDHWDAL